MANDEADPSSLEEKERASNISNTKDEDVLDVEDIIHDDNRYPQGVNLACIVIALILSMFLASLDLVYIPFFLSPT
jgi:hypothetical protein